MLSNVTGWIKKLTEAGVGLVGGGIQNGSILDMSNTNNQPQEQYFLRNIRSSNSCT